jgi:transcriptional regulator with XRE-family HTH domain
LTIKNKIQKLISELRDRLYRQAYVEAHAKDTIAFQLRRMRLARGWEQKDIATKLGNPKLQPMISRYENPDYGRYSVATLLELAKVFDVALVVRFTKFGELVRWDLHKTAATLQPVSYADDIELRAMASESWMWRSEVRPNYAACFSLTGYTGTPVPRLDGGSPGLGQKYILEGDTRAMAKAA